MKIRYITVDSKETVEQKSRAPTYKKMSDFLGGPVEGFDLLVERAETKPRRARMYVNEDGSIIELSVNPKATRLCIVAARLMGTRCTQFIRGPVIVTEPDGN